MLHWKWETALSVSTILFSEPWKRSLWLFIIIYYSLYFPIIFAIYKAIIMIYCYWNYSSPIFWLDCKIQVSLNDGFQEQLNSVLHIKFHLADWYENPINSVVLTFPLDEIVFPTVTLCPQDSRPDRWGSVIKIFDHLNTDCGTRRWDYVVKWGGNDLISNSLRERIQNFLRHSYF